MQHAFDMLMVGIWWDEGLLSEVLQGDPNTYAVPGPKKDHYTMLRLQKEAPLIEPPLHTYLKLLHILLQCTSSNPLSVV
jgi:hypothetical protein